MLPGKQTWLSLSLSVVCLDSLSVAFMLSYKMDFTFCDIMPGLAIHHIY